MQPGVPTAVKTAKNRDIITGDHEIDEERKPVKDRAPDMSMHDRVDQGNLLEATKQIGNVLKKFSAEAWSLILVPELRIFHILFGQGPDDDLVLQCGRSSRFRTSSQEDPAPGFDSTSTSRRSSSSRCHSGIGNDSRLASSATVSQMASTSSIRSLTLNRFASSRSVFTA